MYYTQVYWFLTSSFNSRGKVIISRNAHVGVTPTAVYSTLQSSRKTYKHTKVLIQREHSMFIRQTDYFIRLEGLNISLWSEGLLTCKTEKRCQTFQSQCTFPRAKKSSGFTDFPIVCAFNLWSVDRTPCISSIHR